MSIRRWAAFAGMAAGFVATEVRAQDPLPPVLPPPITANPRLARSAGVDISGLTGPAPVGLQIVNNVFGAVGLKWQVGGAGTQSYSVERWKQDDPRCCSVIVNDLKNPQAWAGMDPSPRWTDTPLPLPGVYVYRVTIVYADGKRGSAELTYSRPAPSHPAKLTAAVETGPDAGSNWKYIAINLNWTLMWGAASYILRGPGLPAAGLQLDTRVSSFIAGVRVEPYEVHTTTYKVLNIPAGSQTWTVEAVFPAPMGIAPGVPTSTTLNLPTP